jgi:hypothetical protein
MSRASTRQAKRASLIYPESSVLDAIALQDAGGRVKSLFKVHSVVGFGSVQHLIEAYRIEDSEKRARLMRTILRVARQRETDPLMYRELISFLGEVRRFHPDWLTPNPDFSLINADREWHRRAWEGLMRDPYHRPAGVLRNREFVRAVIGESKRRQKETRSAKVEGRPRPVVIEDPVLRSKLQPLIDALPAPEAVWREEAAGIWWNAAARADDQVRSLGEWIAPLLRVDQIDLLTWMHFWLAEIDPQAIPATRVQLLTGYFLADFKVDAGHPGDMLHAGYGTVTDHLLTADADFYTVLSNVAALPATKMAVPIFVDRSGPDIVGAIAAAMGWTPV